MPNKKTPLTRLFKYLEVAALALTFASTRGIAGETHVQASLVERGAYLVRVMGCNDCHTPGYLAHEGAVPREQWLTGDSLGWNGPWGTTYGSNLRIFMKGYSEKEWVKVAKTLRRRPPMPWFNLNSAKEADLIAIYHFIRSLDDTGKPAPAALPPGVEPPLPHAKFYFPVEAKR